MMLVMQLYVLLDAASQQGLQSLCFSILELLLAIAFALQRVVVLVAIVSAIVVG